MRLRLACVCALIFAAVAAAPASAKEQANVHLWIASGIDDGGMLWQLQGGKITVKGNIKPFVKGETMLLTIRQGGNKLVSQRVNVKKGKHGKGRFIASLPVTSSGSDLVVRAKHQKSANQKKGLSNKLLFGAIWPSAGGGQSGQNVRLLQLGLLEQGYSSPIGGYWDDGTARAVLAFRKVNWLSHDSTADRDVYRRLFHHDGAFRLRSGSPATHVEADLSRQVMVLTQNGVAWRTFSISSGKPSTPTVQGNFTFYRKSPGYNSHGMYYSAYFYGGYATHGYADVPPNYPASHGCLRSPIPDAHFIYDNIAIGEPIYVYSSQ